MLTRIRSDRGASAVEYGLLVAGIAVTLLLAVPILQSGMASAYQNASSAMVEVPPGVASSAPDAGPGTPPPPSAPAPVATPTPTPTATPTPTPTTTPTPTPTPPATSTPAPTSSPTPDYRVGQDDDITMDVLASGSSKTGTPTVSPASAGEVQWKGTMLQFEADDDARPGPVTITFQYKKGSTVYTDTVTVLIERD